MCILQKEPSQYQLLIQSSFFHSPPFVSRVHKGRSFSKPQRWHSGEVALPIVITNNKMQSTPGHLIKQKANDIEAFHFYYTLFSTCDHRER